MIWSVWKELCLRIMPEFVAHLKTALQSAANIAKEKLWGFAECRSLLKTLIILLLRKIPNTVSYIL